MSRASLYLTRVVVCCTWLCSLAIVGIWLLLYCGGDRWWLPTVILFGPRWICALPLLLLVPAAALSRPRTLWPLLIIGAILVGPVMGFCVPWARLSPADGPTVRVLTCNVQGNRLDSEALLTLVKRVRPDIVALQEFSSDTQMKWPAGWHVHAKGQLLIASHHPTCDVESARRQHPPSRWPPVNGLRCVVETPRQRVAFVNVHLRSARRGLETVLDRQTVVSPERSPALLANIEFRRRESEELARWVGRFSRQVILAGDFNMPTDSAIYRRFWGKYSNAYSTSGFGFGYTKWSAIIGLKYGLRIDHVLAGTGWRSRCCWVGPDVGSDHRPLIADLYWDGPSDDGR